MDIHQVRMKGRQYRIFNGMCGSPTNLEVEGLMEAGKDIAATFQDRPVIFQGSLIMNDLLFGAMSPLGQCLFFGVRYLVSLVDSEVWLVDARLLTSCCVAPPRDPRVSGGP